MNLIGKWKVKELPVYPEPCKTIFVAVEELPKYITDEDLLNEYMQQASFIYEFCEDGTVEIMMPIPEEMMEKAKEQGISGRTMRDVRSHRAAVQKIFWMAARCFVWVYCFWGDYAGARLRGYF